MTNLQCCQSKLDIMHDAIVPVCVGVRAYVCVHVWESFFQLWIKKVRNHLPGGVLRMCLSFIITKWHLPGFHKEITCEDGSIEILAF